MKNQKQGNIPPNAPSPPDTGKAKSVKEAEMVEYDGVMFDASVKTLKERLENAKTLNEKQFCHAEMTEHLLRYARKKGFQARIADAHAVDRHRANSCHYLYLAVDIDLFKKGKYLDQSGAHAELGKFWQWMGGVWGGAWGDGNHYSVEHEGRK